MVENWVEIKEPKTNNNEIKEYVIKKSDKDEYISSISQEKHPNGKTYIEIINDINKSYIFELTFEDVNNIVKNINKSCGYTEDDIIKYLPIEVEQSMTSWCNGNDSGSHKTVMPVSKGPGIIPTLSAEVEGLREENKKLKEEIKKLLELKEMVDISIKENKVLYNSDEIESLKEENKRLKEQVGDLYTKNIGDRFAALEDTEYLKEENIKLKSKIELYNDETIEYLKAMYNRAYELLNKTVIYLSSDENTAPLRFEIEDWCKEFRKIDE